MSPFLPIRRSIDERKVSTLNGNARQMSHPAFRQISFSWDASEDSSVITGMSLSFLPVLSLAVSCPVVCDILKVESFDIFGHGFCPEVSLPISGVKKCQHPE